MRKMRVTSGRRRWAVTGKWWQCIQSGWRKPGELFNRDEEFCVEPLFAEGVYFVASAKQAIARFIREYGTPALVDCYVLEGSE